MILKKKAFYKGFALTNEFHFECLGYTPMNPHLGMNAAAKGDVESWIIKQNSVLVGNVVCICS